MNTPIEKAVTSDVTPKRVVHVLAGTGFGGAERVACTLVHFARKDGYHVSIDAAPGTRRGLDGYGQTTPATEEDLRAWTRAATQRVRAAQPGLVHVHLATPSLLSCALRIALGHAALFTLHLLPEARWPLDRVLPVPSKWLLALGSRLGRRWYFNTVSGNDARLLGGVVPPHKLHTILNAPPLGDAEVSGGHAAWPHGGLRLLAVGRLVQQKGYDRLLRSLAAQELTACAWHLVIVGDGPERERLSGLASSLGLQSRVTWLGAVAATPWLRRADLVLSTSLYEGMPLVPLEAVREGSPILVSDIPPHRELFQTLAPHALLPSDEQEWPRYLGMYLTHEHCRAELAKSQTALQTLGDPRRQWREYATLYERVTARETAESH